MIIYNQLWLTNLRLINQAKEDHYRGLINDDELDMIIKNHPTGFYRPGILPVIGLFVLTCVIVFASLGFLSLLASGGGVLNSPAWPFILGIGCYVALEYAVRNKHYLHSGVDNALLYTSGSLGIGSLMWLIYDMHLSSGSENIMNALLVCLICACLTLRFADLLTSAISTVAFFVFLFFLWSQAGSFGEATAPFIMIMISGAAYWGISKLHQTAAYIQYRDCLTMVLIICLLVCYAAGNYYVVNMLINELHHWYNETHKTLPMGWFFWLWTILTPFAYLAFGLMKKDVLRIRLGLVLIGAAVFTFRNYYHVLAVEYALSLGGAILLAAAYGIIRYLKTAKHGYTYAQADQPPKFNHLQVTSLIVGETMTHLPVAATSEPQSPFGGGSAGGGGSSGSF